MQSHQSRRNVLRAPERPASYDCTCDEDFDADSIEENALTYGTDTTDHEFDRNLQVTTNERSLPETTQE